MSFDYYEPRTLDEAIDLLQRGGPDTAVLAGGTDLLLRIRRRVRAYSAVVNLKRIPGLSGIEWDADGVTIGALTPFRVIESDARILQTYPALVDGAKVVAGVQIRNLATIGGNLANASPSADSVPPMVVLGAVVTIVGPSGERTMPVEETITGPATTALAPGEIFTSIRLPLPVEGSSSAFERFTPRSAMDIGIVSAAASFAVRADGTVHNPRIALGAVSPRPLRVAAAETLLTGRALSTELIEEAATLAAAAATPISDIRGGADYRRSLTRVMTRRVIETAAERAGAGIPA